MYWSIGDAETSVLTIPFVELGVDFDQTLTLVTEEGEDLENAYISVARSDQAGYIEAKLSRSESYSAVMGLFDANCYLGNIAAETETDIDFQALFAGRRGRWITLFSDRRVSRRRSETTRSGIPE